MAVTHQDRRPPHNGIHGGGVTRDPIVLLSFAYSGARFVQSILAANNDLACTASTGIIPMCAAVAETWRRLEHRDGQTMSRLALSTLRSLIETQIITILAGTGRTRWCELATTSPVAAECFLQVLPHTRFVCVHCSSMNAISLGLRENPWGLQGQILGAYLLPYLGNNAAALAAYWADSTEQLIEFEKAHRDITCHLRYEDVVRNPDQAVGDIGSFLGLSRPSENQTLASDRLRLSEPDTGRPEPLELDIFMQVIPEHLRERVSRLHEELDYPLLA